MSLNTNYDELYRTFLKVDFLDVPPMDGPKNEAAARDAIEKGRPSLPAGYRKGYVAPLLDNLPYLLANCDQADALCGAVYDHAPDSPFQKAIKGFVAVNSNLYRSYGVAGSRKIPEFPPAAQLPPLATFRRQMVNPDDIFPNTLTVDQVHKYCGGNVAVVAMPHCYSRHPIVWAVLAHETGGHAVLHAVRTLVPELKKALSDFLAKQLRNEKQWDRRHKRFVNCLWQYWLEESAAHVYGVLNIGPSFGPGVIAYISALSQQATQKVAECLDKSVDHGQAHPAMSSAPCVPAPADLDRHPTLLLQVYVILGAIDALKDLCPATRDVYANGLEAWARASAQNSAKQLQLSGYMKIQQGKGIMLNTGDYDLPLDLMQKYARMVGRYIATAPLKVFGGRAICDIETWDDADENRAQKIREALSENASIVDLGDDAQLLAGSLLALLEKPVVDFYQSITERLLDALTNSFDKDEIWGTKVTPRSIRRHFTGQHQTSNDPAKPGVETRSGQARRAGGTGHGRSRLHRGPGH